MPSSSALYLYCLARPACGFALDSLRGVDGDGPVDLIRLKDIVAVVSEVRREDFVGPPADAQMSDLAWVGPRVCRHEELVERVMRSCPIVPARFATLFSSHASVINWMGRHHEAISHALDRFANHGEWAVKGTLDRRTAETRVFAVALARAGSQLSSSPGTRYFEEQRIRAESRQDLDAWLKSAGAGIAKTLLDCAAAFRERPVVCGGPSAEEGATILNWAFLVPDSRREEFHAQIRRMNTEHAHYGLRLDVSGPWPPYSFCPALDAEPTS